MCASTAKKGAPNFWNTNSFYIVYKNSLTSSGVLAFAQCKCASFSQFLNTNKDGMFRHVHSFQSCQIGLFALLCLNPDI